MTARRCLVVRTVVDETDEFISRAIALRGCTWKHREHDEGGAMYAVCTDFCVASCKRGLVST